MARLQIGIPMVGGKLAEARFYPPYNTTEPWLTPKRLIGKAYVSHRNSGEFRYERTPSRMNDITCAQRRTLRSSGTMSLD